MTPVAIEPRTFPFGASVMYAYVVIGEKDVHLVMVICTWESDKGSTGRP